jgi:MFS_1 like family
MFLLTIVSVVHLDVEMQVQKDIKLLRNVREIIRLPDITVFLLMMAITSVCYNYNDSFFYVYLTELGASDLLMS